MDEITWTVTLTWCYDGKHIAKTAKENCENAEEYRDALIDVINSEVCGEDDYLYYNFDGEQAEQVADDLMKRYPYNEQLSLF